MILEMIVNRVSSPIRYKSQEWFGPPWFQSYFLLAGRSRLLEINFSPLAPINQSFLDFDVGPLVDGEQSQTLGKLIVPSVFLFCSTGIIFEFLAPISTRLLTTPTIVINCNHVWKYTFFLISLFRIIFFKIIEEDTLINTFLSLFVSKPSFGFKRYYTIMDTIHLNKPILLIDVLVKVSWNLSTIFLI